LIMVANATYSPSYLAQSKATVLNIFYSIPIAVVLISTALRIWAKVSRNVDARLGYDDYLMVFATIVTVALCISGLVYGPPYGLGRHIQALSEYDLHMYMLGDYIFSHFYDVAIACTKLSILALYYRLFSSKQIFRILVIATAVFVVAWVIVMEVVLGFSCRPIKAFWGDGKGTCINLVAFTYFTNITNLVLDLWIFSMPIPIIVRLQASREKKIGLCFLFSIGLGTCAISAARLSFIFGVGSVDFTWVEATLGILSAWEPTGGILCANLPIIYGPLVHRIKGSRRSSHGSEPWTNDRSGYQGHSKGGLHHNWAWLSHSGSRVINHGNATRGLHAKEAYTAPIEMENLEANRIMEYHDLQQDT